MIRYIVKRLVMMIPILLGISFIVLILIDISPGDVARIIVGSEAEEWEYQQVREELRLDDPLLVRYGRFIVNTLKGDFGKSFITKKDVWADMMSRFPYTLALAALSLVIAVLIGIPIGIYAATHQYTWKDNTAILLSLFCVSMPAFWFALILVQIFAVKIRLLPPAGIDSWKGWVLPSISLALGYAAAIARQMRSNMLEVIRQDFIVTARAKGLSERGFIPARSENALIPVIMIAGTMLRSVSGGALIAEVIFSIPGLGNYTLVAGKPGLSRDSGPFFFSTLFCWYNVYRYPVRVCRPAIRRNTYGKKRYKEVRSSAAASC